MIYSMGARFSANVHSTGIGQAGLAGLDAWRQERLLRRVGGG
jgi:hypothetical protein